VLDRKACFVRRVDLVYCLAAEPPIVSLCPPNRLARCALGLADGSHAALDCHSKRALVVGASCCGVNVLRGGRSNPQSTSTLDHRFWVALGCEQHRKIASWGAVVLMREAQSVVVPLVGDALSSGPRH
jgi:hypothetical protein